MVDKHPVTIKEKMSKEEGEKAKGSLEEAGASVEVQRQSRDLLLEPPRQGPCVPLRMIAAPSGDRQGRDQGRWAGHGDNSDAGLTGQIR